MPSNGKFGAWRKSVNASFTPRPKVLSLLPKRRERFPLTNFWISRQRSAKQQGSWTFSLSLCSKSSSDDRQPEKTHTEMHSLINPGACSAVQRHENFRD